MRYMLLSQLYNDQYIRWYMYVEPVCNASNSKSSRPVPTSRKITDKWDIIQIFLIKFTLARNDKIPRYAISNDWSKLHNKSSTLLHCSPMYYHCNCAQTTVLSLAVADVPIFFHRSRAPLELTPSRRRRAIFRYRSFCRARHPAARRGKSRGWTRVDRSHVNCHCRRSGLPCKFD